MNIYLVRHGESQSNYDNKHDKTIFLWPIRRSFN